MLPRGVVSAKRINEVLKTESTIISGSFNGETEIKGRVEFKNVSFRYPDAEMNVLENINFVANKG
jgi:ATP-binding cassette subfamily B protein